MNSEASPPSGDDTSASSSDEDYLAALLGLEEDGLPLIQARLAERLDISPAAVSEAVRRLIQRGFLEPRERSLRFTEEGRGVAHTVVRRHRLAERLLVDVLGLAWEKVHREAARWEHVISHDVEERLVALLGDPATCPHGNRIPGSQQPARDADIRLPTGPGLVTVARVSEHLQVDDDALALLWRTRLLPGCKATVLDVSPESVTVSTAVGDHVIPMAVAAHVWVFPA